MRFMVILASFGLVASIIALATITAIAVVASRYPFDCEDLQALNPCPSPQTEISFFVQQHLSYLQALHAFLLKAVLVCCLAVASIPLNAALWQSLDPLVSHGRRRGAPGMTLLRLDAFIQLSRAPGFTSAARYLKAADFRMSILLLFVLIAGASQFFTDFAVGPVYRTHGGPWSTVSNFSTGGALSVVPGAYINLSLPVAFSINSARIRLASTSQQRINWTSPTGSSSVLPFLGDVDIERTWHLDITNVPVLHTSLDCSPGVAPTQPEDMVSFDDRIWADTDNFVDSRVSIGNKSLGLVDPAARLAWLAYTDAAVTHVGPGFVNATSLNIIIGTNTTIEGAQQTLTQPNATSRLSWVDILYCRSDVMLQLSSCTLEKGVGEASNDTAVACWPLPSASLPVYASAPASWGGLNMTMVRDVPSNIVQALSAAPSVAMQNTYNWLPRFSVSWAYEPYMFPLPYTSAGDGQNLDGEVDGALTHLPLAYVTDTLFPQAQHGLIQGMLWPPPNGNATLPVDLVANFATSRAWLPLTYLVLGTILSTVVLFSAYLSHGARHAAELDLTRVIAISSSHAMREQFSGVCDDGAAVLEQKGRMRVVFEHDGSAGRRSLRPASVGWGGIIDSSPHAPRLSLSQPMGRTTSESSGTSPQTPFSTDGEKLGF